MKRRDFLIGAAAATGLAATRNGWSQGSQQSKLDRIAIMSWGFDKVLKNFDDGSNPARTVAVLDFPQMIADRYGVHNVEMQHAHFESTEADYLQAFRERVARAGSRLTQINVEFDAQNISTRSNPIRVQTIDLTKRWIDHAAALACPRVMVNQGPLTPDVIPSAITALTLIRRYGDSKGVRVTMENRGANWQAMGEVAKAAGAFTNPDVGNFRDQADQLQGIRTLLPQNGGNMHAKLNLPDLPTPIRLTREMAYNGLYSIEVDPPLPDPYGAVSQVRDILLANM
jgi:sugar phosphate isomerase/epimerase